MKTAILTFTGLTIATASLHAAEPEQVYLNRFSNTTWESRAITELGWNAYYLNRDTNEGAELVTYNSGGMQIYNSWFRGPLPDTTGRGILATQTHFPLMRYATTQTFNTAIEAGTFTWDMGASAVSQEVRILVQSNGKWYASRDIFTTTELIADRDAFMAQTSGSEEIGKSFTFEAGVTLWQEASIGVGDSMLLNQSATVLNSNLIDGLGFYFFNNENPRDWQTQRVFIDNLAVSSPIPEPTTVAAALAGISLLVAGGLRRRASGRHQPDAKAN